MRRRKDYTFSADNYVPEAIQGHDAVLIIDGMPIPKFGEDIVGVARQWCGVTGKGGTCQVTVNCTLASSGERHNSDQLTWSLGMRLFLPKKSSNAPDAEYDDQRLRELFAQRREDVNRLDDIEHQTKIVHKSAIQGLMEDKGCGRERVKDFAEYMLKSYSPW